MNQKVDWEESYKRKENYVFYPHEEIIRFTAKHIKKRVGIDDFVPEDKDCKVLDFGCGIGRHLVFYAEMNVDVYGIDLSKEAVAFARKWLKDLGYEETMKNVVQGECNQLPWRDSFFDYAVSHGTLDSMHFDVAFHSISEMARVLKPGGLFYCDLISGDDSRFDIHFQGEEIVKEDHECGTVQSYFGPDKIDQLVEGYFSIVEGKLVKHTDLVTGDFHSRYSLILKKK